MPVTASKLMFCLLPSFVALLAAAPTDAAAKAAPPASIAIASVQFEGNLPEAAREAMLQSLAEGLERGEVSLWGGAKAARAQPCADAACHRELAGRLGVAHLVTGKVVESQKNYEIELELIIGATGRSGGNHRQKCQLCGLSEATERMSLAASALTEKLKLLLREPGRLVVRARPTNAHVVVDGQHRGVVPQEVNLPAGQHKLQLISPGYRTVEREIDIVPAVDQALEVDMMQIPSEFPYGAAGWAAVATGVGLIAAGIVTLAFFNGDAAGCKENEKDPQGDCPTIYGSAWLAGGLLGAGAAAATLGGVWLYLDSNQGSAQGAQTSLNLGWRGRF